MAVAIHFPHVPAAVVVGDEGAMIFPGVVLTDYIFFFRNENSSEMIVI